ncbi:MAG: hypothetical protein ABJD11_06940 [Gemmatimonadota bacterium]
MPATVASPIDDYLRLLTEPVARESAGWLEERLAQRGLFFGTRPLCNVLRPRFLTTANYDFLRARCGLLLGAFNQALAAALASPAVLAQFRLHDWERTLIADDPGFIEGSPLSRLDAFFTADTGELQFTEYNAETPAGTAYGDALAELFLALPAMREFGRQYALRPLPARHHVLNVLVDTWRTWSGRTGRPVIGIIDWAEVPTVSEFELFQDYFTSMGYTCVIGDPRNLEYRNGKLSSGGVPIDIIYKRVLISELIERGGMDQPMVRALRDGAVCMANPFRCKILHKKASLAVLSDERNAALFTAEQRSAILRHIPWTRVVEDRRTEFEGRTVDLMELALAERERMVLKPNDDYGGHGIVLGWETDASGWESALRVAIREPHIIQQRIALPSESFPSLVDGQLVLADRIVDTAPFVFNGSYVDGCLTRVSTAALVNVTAGGGSTVPTFVVEKR